MAVDQLSSSRVARTHVPQRAVADAPVTQLDRIERKLNLLGNLLICLMVAILFLLLQMIPLLRDDWRYQAITMTVATVILTIIRRPFRR